MNYYERHIGDYAKNCSHLSLLEHGVYVRLLDVYYTKEAPIPEDKAARWIGAGTPETLQALQVVLEEFFQLRDGHWHQERADADIAAYLEGEPEREVKKANEDNRQKRHREERAKLFKVLTDRGEHAPWNISMGELRKLVAGVSGAGPDTKPGTEPETRPETPATAPATPATATHSPIPTPQSPATSVPDGTEPPAPAPVQPDLLPPAPPPPMPPAPPAPAVVLVRTVEERERAELWAKGKALLAEEGEAKGAAGAYVGRLIKRWTEVVVIEAIRITVDAPPKNDVKPFLEGLCQRLAGQRQQGGSPYQQQRAARMAEAVPALAGAAPHSPTFIDTEARDVPAIGLG